MVLRESLSTATENSPPKLLSPASQWYSHHHHHYYRLLFKLYRFRCVHHQPGSIVYKHSIVWFKPNGNWRCWWNLDFGRYDWNSRWNAGHQYGRWLQSSHPICQTFQFPPKSFGAIQILLLEWSCWMEWKNCLLGHWRLKSWKAAATGRLWIIRIKWMAWLEIFWIDEGEKY